jgi:hypothetical protein
MARRRSGGIVADDTRCEYLLEDAARHLWVRDVR